MRGPLVLGNLRDVAAVVLGRRRADLGAGVVTVDVRLREGLVHLARQVVAKAYGLVEPQVHACGRTGNHHGRQAVVAVRVPGLADGVHHGEHAAPALAQDVQAVPAKVRGEVLADAGQLVEEERAAPALRQGRRLGAAAGDLVVVDDGTTVLLGDAVKGLQVVVGGSRPAVQDEKGQPARLALPRHPVVRLVPSERDVALALLEHDVALLSAVCSSRRASLQGRRCSLRYAPTRQPARSTR